MSLQMVNLPEFSYKSNTRQSLDLENFFKEFEMNKFLEECNYSEQELYVECRKMKQFQQKRKLKLNHYINTYLESPSVISPVQLLL
ncbi:unnamed protein product (macronuclear) [Paramecium tetraurelia]|uniref:RGS domain-containing protein n=1 Tax=Paramecium tetraurelia TaxID=5888 RepID=A0EHV0_PARTE|nr:uncharacterized protein GSPATT00027218001 [Paramecium tetraurelia]CAK94891.1 unnamed protein product [Paramecium tetraurelia]|eukprot:XP_001462264.1 hypothetical protein (macronuclear) [Paramecium tetraurelia strain d4-2]